MNVKNIFKKFLSFFMSLAFTFNFLSPNIFAADPISTTIKLYLTDNSDKKILPGELLTALKDCIMVYYRDSSEPLDPQPTISINGEGMLTIPVPDGSVGYKIDIPQSAFSGDQIKSLISNLYYQKNSLTSIEVGFGTGNNDFSTAFNFAVLMSKNFLLPAIKGEIAKEAIYAIDVLYTSDAVYYYDKTSTSRIIKNNEASAEYGYESGTNGWYGFDGNSNRIQIINRGSTDINTGVTVGSVSSGLEVKIANDNANSDKITVSSATYDGKTKEEQFAVGKPQDSTYRFNTKSATADLVESLTNVLIDSTLDSDGNYTGTNMFYNIKNAPTGIDAEVDPSDIATITLTFKIA